MIQCFINPILLSAVQYAAFEPGYALMIIVAVLWVLLNAIPEFKGRRRKKEESEERKMLRKNEIDAAVSEADGILSKRLDYYNKLSVKGKEKFMSRLRVILATKEFITRDGLRLTTEIEVMTAAAFVQITFGLRHFRLDRFSKIVIYPDIFYNKLLDRNLKGSASPIGVLRFSWKHIRYGYAVGDDNINLALHELAHALKVSIRKDDDVDEHLEAELNEFLDEGSDLRSDILEGKIDIIRKYAGTNEHEFFACCVEYFFESPDHFKAELPKMYQLICEVLLQDPTNADHDYSFQLMAWKRKKRREVPRKIQFGKNKRIDDNAYPWIPWFLISGLFAGIPLAMFFTYWLENSNTVVWLFFATVIVAGLMLWSRKFLLSGYMSFFSFLVFMMMGWTPLISSGVMLLNYVVPVYYFQETEPITKIAVENYRYYVVVEDSRFRSLRRGLNLEDVQARQLRKRMPGVRVTTEAHFGLFGLEVVDDMVKFEGGGIVSNEKAKELYQSLVSLNDGRVDEALEWKYTFLITNPLVEANFIEDMAELGLVKHREEEAVGNLSMLVLKETAHFESEQALAKRINEIELAAGKYKMNVHHLNAARPYVSPS